MATTPTIPTVRSPRATAADTERARFLLITGLLFVVAILLALVILPPLLNLRTDALRGRAERATRFADTLAETEDRLQELRVTARGFVITRSPSFLDQYQAVRENLPPLRATITDLAPQVDPAFAPPAGEMLDAVERWQREAGDQQIALASAGHVDDAAAMIAAGTGQTIFDAFRSRATALRNRTSDIQSEIQAELSRVRALQVAITSGLGVLGLLAAGLVVVGFRQMILLQRALERARLHADELAATARALYEAAQIERRRLEAVFAHSPEGIVVAELADRRIVLANAAAEALLGPLTPGTPLDPHPLDGRAFQPGGQPEAPERLPLATTLADGAEQRGELVVAAPDGERVPVFVTSVPLRDDDGALQGAVAVVQDLRQLRSVERLKSDFVALVSHELRTPLTAIKGASQTLLRRQSLPDGEHVRELMAIVDEQSDRLQELIDNLLSLSQLEAGALQLRRETLELLPVIQRVVRQLRERAAGIRLQVEAPPALPTVSADPRRIEQVLANLVENAIKFSPEGATITIGAVVDDGAVRLSVRDRGPGIPPADRERVFERFYQAAQPNTRSLGGTGLGLAICRALVEAHGGRIWAEAAPGGGALLQFTLPALAVDAVPFGRPALLANGQGGARVLVVDDDPALQRVVRRGLEDAAYRVLTAADGQAAFDALAEHMPDLVLLDVALPGSDGFAMVQEIREWSAVPIIMLTARAAEHDVVRGLQLGADDYVTKPFRLSELLARIEAVLRRGASAASDEPALIENDTLAIDLAWRRVSMRGAEVTLTPIEYRILAFLARHIGQVLTHEQILHDVWGEGYGSENHYLWVHVAHLRQKIEDDPRKPRLILTERGVGYRMPRLE